MSMSTCVIHINRMHCKATRAAYIPLRPLGVVGGVCGRRSEFFRAKALGLGGADGAEAFFLFPFSIAICLFQKKLTYC